MASQPIYASRVMQLPLVDGEGATLGRVEDLVLVPPHRGGAPRVIGFVAAVQRRRIFVNAGRVGEVDQAGVRLRSAAIDLRHFVKRAGEITARELLDRRVADESVADLALQPTQGRASTWEVATVALASRTGFRRRVVRVVPWGDVTGLFDTVGVPRELAAYRDMHPSDVATAVRRLPLARRRLLTAAMDDERLADVLEELPEEDQVRLIAELDVARAAHVLEEMAPDDAADLLAEMPGDQQRRLLDAMEPDEADPLRQLLRYGEHTAGGLMTPEPPIVTASTPVAEVLARLRDPELAPALAAQAFVADPPSAPPTGPYLGSVGIQRLLREPPGMAVGRCIDGDEPPVVPPNMPEAEVAARLAAYNLLAVAVCDAEGHLLGAVSIDDVLDAVLPEGWRARASSRS